MSTSKDQERAISLMSEGKSVFLTGGAGTGKTFTIEEFCRRNPERKVARLATTGAAAQLVGGQTVHSFFGLRPRMHMPHDLRCSASIRALMKKFDTFIIDEISMLRIDQFQAIRDRMFSAGRGYGDFAGYQLIASGDFSQLPPVITDEEIEPLSHLYGPGNRFAFQSRYWKGLITAELTTMHRQADDLIFAEWLAGIRRGEMPDVEFINQRVAARPDTSIILTATNKAAFAINEEEMEKIPGGHYRIEGQIVGDFDKRNMRVAPVYGLKPGARVVICANNRDEGYVNGSSGQLVECRRDGAGLPVGIVQLDAGSRVIVRSHTWENLAYTISKEGKVEHKVIGEYTQLPLLPGWAITIHRSQGMSLEQVHVDTRGVFESGQSYVALSRATKLDALTLAAPVTEEAFIFDEDVRTFVGNGYRPAMAA